MCAFIIGNAIGYYIRVYFNWPEPTVFQTPESIIGGVLGVVIVFPLIQTKNKQILGKEHHMIIKQILLSALLIMPLGVQASMTTRVCASMKKMVSEASLYMKQSADIIKGFTKTLLLDSNSNLDLLVGYALIISGGVHIGLFGLKKIFPNAEYDTEARMIKAKQQLDQLEREMAQEMPFEERLRLALQQDEAKNMHRLKS